MGESNTIQFIGTGSYLPPKVLTNNDLEKMVDTSNEWIVTRSGIKERRITDENTATSDLAAKAAKNALDNASLKPEDIDLIIVATVTPDYPFPSTACMVQKKIGAVNAAAFDLSAACSGFLYALSVGASMLNCGGYKNIMVIGAEALSKITDWKDRSTCVLFGDGAGAVIIRSSDDSGSRILYSELGAEGEGEDLLKVPAGGSAMPASSETVKNRDHYIKMRGNELFKWAVKKMGCLVVDAVKESGLSPDDVKCIIPHQVNMRIITAAMRKTSIPVEKVILTLDKYGNTSAASIPIALDEANREGKLKKGDVVVFVAFGSGLTYASMVIRW